MNIWHEISEERIKKDDFITVVEITKGGKNKYELDKETGMLKLDRVLYTATHYPANYGFIPRTYAEDNDPLDVLVLCNEDIQPLTLVECYPVGVLIMTDSEQKDEKIIAIPKKDPFLNIYNDITDVPQHLEIEIKHFFEVYKQLENKKTIVEKIYKNVWIDIKKNLVKNKEFIYGRKDNIDSNFVCTFCLYFII